MKKILKTILVIGLAIGAILIFVFFNLKSNSVYYAKHMSKGDKQYPEIMMLIDDLDWLYQPEIEGLEYDIDGTHVIRKKNGKSRISGNGEDYLYADEYNISYRLDKNFQLIRATDATHYTKIDINTIDQDKVISEIKELVQPVIDAQREPFPNLQWVFNWLNQDRFK